MLDTLEEVDGHFRKLDKKRLDQEMDGICKRIGECAHKLLPMDDYDEEDHKSSEILHSSSTQHNNHLLLERYCMLRQQRSVCLLSLLVFPEHAIIKNLSTIYWWIGESYVENTEDKTAEEVGEDVIDELLKLNLIVPYGNAKYPLVNKFQIHPHILPLLESSDLLRGISRISELPPSIAQLESLEILDLKACHNLETLPNYISSMKHLTHLINLKELRRLSIHIGSEAVIKDGEFESLGELSALKHLKISWGVSETRYSDLPPTLKKLHLEGFPGQKVPEFLKPSKLPSGFKQLKIIGGKLQSMNDDDDVNKWGMEIVHLK
ncbi:Disease resistance RPP13-like protein 4 [Glycine max]|nr:Disease resistance RPP13-like protein 4 [Glycine max]